MTTAGRVAFGRPKTAKSRRSLPIPDSLGRMLLEHKDRQQPEGDTALEFTTEDGGISHPDNFPRQHFKALLRAAGISTEVRLYHLRHTHATLPLKAGVHPKIVS